MKDRDALIVRVRETERRIEVESLATDRLTLYLDDRAYEVVILQRERDGRVLLLVDHRPVEAVMLTSATGRVLYMDGAVFPVRIEDEKQFRMHQLVRAKSHGPQEMEVRAPMPGLIHSVLVEPDQVIVVGETLLIVEAMKMENELRATAAGRVHLVKVRRGDAVSAGDLLLTIQRYEV